MIKNYMRKIYTSLILIIVLKAQLIGQSKAENFEIKLSKKKHANALYNKIIYADARSNKSHFGIIKVGDNGYTAAVMPIYSMEEQVQNALLSMVDSTAQNGTLLLEIVKFEISESEQGEIGYSKFKANMYSIRDSSCNKIHSMDTSLKYNFGVDVSGMLVASSAAMVSDFILNCIHRTIQDSTNYPELLKIAETKQIDKSKMSAYNTSQLKDGVYLDYESFKNQLPLYYCIVEKDSLKGIKVKTMDGDGIALSNDIKIYSVVYKGICYYNLGMNSYTILTKENNDFYFTKYIDDGANVGKVILKAVLNSANIAPIGSPIPIYLPLGDEIFDDDELRKKALVKMKLHHISGRPVLVKRL
jgi:hypothetical protein